MGDSQAEHGVHVLREGVPLEWGKQRKDSRPVPGVDGSLIGRIFKPRLWFQSSPQPQTSAKTRSAFSPRMPRICSSEHPRPTRPRVMFGKSR